MPEGAKKSFIPENKPRLEKLRDAYAKPGAFDAATLETTLKAVGRRTGRESGSACASCETRLHGQELGPSLYHLMEVLGKAKTLARIECALAGF
jgi:glutamyl-tRNA synthetase